MRILLNLPEVGLPPIVHTEIVSIAAKVQAPIELVTTCVLSLLGAGSQSVINVETPVGEISPTSVSTIVIAESGNRKSAVEDMAYREVRKFDEEQDRRYAKIKSKNKIERQAWQLKIRVAQKRLVNALSEERPNILNFEDEYKNLLAQEPLIERCCHIIYNDFTIAALMKSLAERWPHASIISSEATKILQNLSQQVSQQNTIHDGPRSMTINRKVEGDLLVLDPRLSMALMVHPEIFRKFRELSATLAGATGLFNRMLVCEPPSLQGSRMLCPFTLGFDRTDEISPFQQRMAELLIEGEALVKSGGQRKLMRFSPEARTRWVEYHNLTESWIGVGGSLEEVRGYASKVMNNMSRIAAILTYFAGGSTVIQIENLAAAAMLCNYYNSEFKAIFGQEGQADIPKDYAKSWEAWFRQRFTFHGRTSFRMGELYKEGPGNLRKKAQVEVALETLSAQGKVTVMRAQNGRAHTVFLNVDP